MTTILNRNAILLTIVLVSVCSASAQMYSGRAVGIYATSTINGTTATHVAGDTGPLPPNGQSISITVPSTLVPGSTLTGLIASDTSGILKSSQSASIVNDLDFYINGARVRANRVVANATCLCCPGSAEGACFGGSIITGLTITDAAGATSNVAVTGQANQQVPLPNGIGTITINEQTNGFETISVTGLHIVATSGGNTYDVKVATISTGISCAVVLPTPAKVTVSGRVFDPNGRSVSNASVTLNDMAGGVRTAVTNSFGNFSFAEVEVGRSYMLQATSKNYSFDPVVFSLSDAMTVDLRASGSR
jgi:hypothetical protein